MKLKYLAVGDVIKKPFGIVEVVKGVRFDSSNGALFKVVWETTCGKFYHGRPESTVKIAGE